MKRIAVLALAVTGLVGTLGMSPAAAGQDPHTLPETHHCDWTWWDMYCEFENGEWWACDYDSELGAVIRCDHGKGDDARPTDPSVPLR